MEARNKINSEALLKEQKVILGGLIDFCQLLICLPKNRLVARSEVASKMIKDGASTEKEIEVNIGHTRYGASLGGPKTLKHNILRVF